MYILICQHLYSLVQCTYPVGMLVIYYLMVFPEFRCRELSEERESEEVRSGWRVESDGCVVSDEPFVMNMTVFYSTLN